VIDEHYVDGLHGGEHHQQLRGDKLEDVPLQQGFQTGQAHVRNAIWFHWAFCPQGFTMESLLTDYASIPNITNGSTMKQDYGFGEHHGDELHYAELAMGTMLIQTSTFLSTVFLAVGMAGGLFRGHHD